MKFILWMLFMLKHIWFVKMLHSAIANSTFETQVHFFFGQEMSAFDAQSCCL